MLDVKSAIVVQTDSAKVSIDWNREYDYPWKLFVTLEDHSSGYLAIKTVSLHSFFDVLGITKQDCLDAFSSEGGN